MSEKYPGKESSLGLLASRVNTLSTEQFGKTLTIIIQSNNLLAITSSLQYHPDQQTKPQV